MTAPPPDRADATGIAPPLATADPWALLRRLEATHPGRPRLGAAVRWQDDIVRLHQPPSLAFATRTVAAVAPPRAGGAWSVRWHGFGVWGPNGPLPLHLTEQVRERLRKQPPDAAWAAFVNVLQQRMACLFHRARVDPEPAACADRADDAFGTRLAAVGGVAPGPEGAHACAADRDSARLARALPAWTGRRWSTPEGAGRLLTVLLDARVRLAPAVRWLRVPAAARGRLGGDPGSSALGRVVLGDRVRDVGLALRAVVGPLDAAAYDRLSEALLAPDSPLRARVRRAIGMGPDIAWRLVLAPGHRLEARLTAPSRLASPLTPPPARLGRSACLGPRPRDPPA